MRIEIEKLPVSARSEIKSNQGELISNDQSFHNNTMIPNELSGISKENGQESNCNNLRLILIADRTPKNRKELKEKFAKKIFCILDTSKDVCSTCRFRIVSTFWLIIL